MRSIREKNDVTYKIKEAQQQFRNVITPIEGGQCTSTLITLLLLSSAAIATADGARRTLKDQQSSGTSNKHSQNQQQHHKQHQEQSKNNTHNKVANHSSQAAKSQDALFNSHDKMTFKQAGNISLEAIKKKITIDTTAKVDKVKCHSTLPNKIKECMNTQPGANELINRVLQQPNVEIVCTSKERISEGVTHRKNESGYEGATAYFSAKNKMVVSLTPDPKTKNVKHEFIHADSGLRHTHEPCKLAAFAMSPVFPVNEKTLNEFNDAANKIITAAKYYVDLYSKNANNQAFTRNEKKDWDYFNKAKPHFGVIIREMEVTHAKYSVYKEQVGSYLPYIHTSGFEYPLKVSGYRERNGKYYIDVDTTQETHMLEWAIRVSTLEAHIKLNYPAIPGKPLLSFQRRMDEKNAYISDTTSETGLKYFDGADYLKLQKKHEQDCPYPGEEIDENTYSMKM